MGIFKKKQDPISERAKDLQRQIADLEAQIQQLNAQKVDGDSESSPPGSPAYQVSTVAPSSKIPQFNVREPRLRSTTHPHGPTIVNPTAAPLTPQAPSPLEPIFEEVRQNPFRSGTEGPGRHRDQALGIRQDDFASFWQRVKNHFRGPVTSNPKLVNYLAAGSIQGLRPLRYERRIARNRFIVLVIILVLILWGILALLLKR